MCLVTRLMMVMAVFLTMITVPAIAATTASPVPATPPVPEGHPRVYIRPGDLPALRTKVASEEFKSSWDKVRAATENPQFGPFCAAFVYLVNGDKAMGRRAIENGLAILSKTDEGRVPYAPMHWAACVYDWCYDLLTTEEKQQFVAQFERLATSHDPHYPARFGASTVVGHTAEGWLLSGQLPIGVAIYDESPAMYDAAARLFFEKFVPARNFHYAAHSHHQGDSYNSRLSHDLFAAWLFRRLGAGDVFSPELQFVPYETIYNLRPDGRQFRSGDTFDESGKAATRRLIQLLAGAYYDDSYEMWMADSPFFYPPTPFELVFELLLRKPNAVKRPISELPFTKYFGSPIGTMISRTGWNFGLESRDAVVRMHIGETFFGNHQRKDFGTFQMFYRGPLAISSGMYEGSDSGYGSDHWREYYHQTIAHNGLLIFDPSEEMFFWGRVGANDGGQRWSMRGADHPGDLETLQKDYQLGRVTAHAFGPDAQAPDFSYIAGDITAAYSAKAKKVTRAMVSLNTGDTRFPCVLVVFDRVSAANAAFKKTWLLHTIEEPQVENRTIEAPHPGGGKLVVESLLPATADLAKIGGPGKEFWIESVKRNYATAKAGAEGGAWRVEVSPSTPTTDDIFLHTLAVTDNDTLQGPPAQKIENENLIGAHILDRVVLFSRSGELLSNVSFQIQGQESLRFLVCDLQPGQWKLSRNGISIPHLTATAEGQSIFFNGLPGHYQLTRVATQ